MSRIVVEFNDNELEVISAVAEHYGVSIEEYVIVAALQDAVEGNLALLRDVVGDA